jgi:hypothetical protein
MSDKRVIAKWTGEYPCLCTGEWVLKVDGKDVSNKIPLDLKNSDMNTYGTYRNWYFENYIETFKFYKDGLKKHEWIQDNQEWLKKITEDTILQEEIFDAINEQDFRWNSCGGCI